MARIQELSLNRGNRALLLLALVAGLVAAVLVFVALNQGEDETTAVPAGSDVTVATVVVAAQSIPAGAEITEDMLKTIQVPEELLVAGSYGNTTPIVGQKARVAIAPNEQVTVAKVGAQDAGEGLDYVVPPGMRALAIKVEEATAVGGLLLPGQRVDIIAKFTEGEGENEVPVIYRVLHDVEVLAVAQVAQEPLPAPAEGEEATQLPTSGQRPEDVEKQPRAQTVTVAVTPDQAVLLVCAQEEADRVWLALRPFGERGEPAAAPPRCVVGP
jgi:pilus assembly protein CpaB